jgi:Uma2 family endonuclease
MATRPEGWLTPAAYLALERKAETKSEYLDGTLIAMSGATRAHILITSNLVRVLGNQLLDRPYEVYPQVMRVRITEGDMYAYPDVVVGCG